MLASPPLYSIPIADRARPTLPNQLRKTAFNLFFAFWLVLLHSCQLVVFPLYIPFRPARKLWHVVQSFIKDSFGSLLVALVQLWGPSKLIITADESINLEEELVLRDGNGVVVGLKFPRQSLFIANHQQYADWVYLWILFAFGGIGRGICIILKASLRWAPIVGPAMQMFQFAFVSKMDPLQNSRIYPLAKQSVDHDRPFALLLFPEGTLISPSTRPKSAAFAKANDVPDFKHLLLPRSTGLLYCMRTLAALSNVNLPVFDCTVGYTGVPDRSYAQAHYTLQSIFGLGISPPEVHIHLSKLDLASAPIGVLRQSLNHADLDAQVTVQERAVFQEYTRCRFMVKDDLLSNFYEREEFPQGGQERVEIDIRLRREDYLRLGTAPFVVGTAYLVGKILLGWIF